MEETNMQIPVVDNANSSQNYIKFSDYPVSSSIQKSQAKPVIYYCSAPGLLPSAAPNSAYSLDPRGL